MVRKTKSDHAEQSLKQKGKDKTAKSKNGKEWKKGRAKERAQKEVKWADAPEGPMPSGSDSEDEEEDEIMGKEDPNRGDNIEIDNVTYDKILHEIKSASSQSEYQTSAFKRLKIDGDLLDDNEVWNFTGVERNKFYAAAFVYDCIDAQRSCIPQNRHVAQSEALDCELLDQLALLFSRAKRINTEKGVIVRDDHACPSSTGQNVTATAMGAHHLVPEGPKRRFYQSIYIAKNDGPQYFDNISDEEFGDKLASWYNLLDSNDLQQMPRKDPMWRAMQDFWFHRHRYYIHEILATRKRWKTLGMDLGATNPPHAFTTAIVSQDKGLQLFQDDWTHVSKLIEWLDQTTASSTILDDKNVLSSYLDNLCFNDDEEWKLSYRKRRTTVDVSEMDVLEDEFRRVIKHFKMLKTVLTVWNAIISLRKDPQQSLFSTSLKLVFLPRQDVVPISSRELQAIVQNWEKQAEDVKVKQKLKQAREHLIRTGQQIFRNIHCELQLLQMHGENPQSAWDGSSIGSYLGCSKLSCFLCWELLRSQGYTTKNTHGKLHYGCAFPLQLFSGKWNLDSIQCLKDIAVSVIRDIELALWNSVDQNNAYDARSDTTAASRRLLEYPILPREDPRPPKLFRPDIRQWN